MLGCTTDGPYLSEVFGDEVAFARDVQHLDFGDAEAFGRWVMESFTAGRPAGEQRRMIEKLSSYTPGRRLAALAGLDHVFERWDGTGAPGGIAGESIAPMVRVLVLANEIEVHHRLGGRDTAVAMARQRSGGAFDPAVVEAFCADPDAVLAMIGGRAG